MVQKSWFENMNRKKCFKPKFTEHPYDNTSISNAGLIIPSDNGKYLETMIKGKDNNTHVTDAILSLKKKYPYIVFSGKVHFDLGTYLSPNVKHEIISNHRLIFHPEPVSNNFIDYFLAASIDSKNKLLQDNDRKCKVLVLMPEYTNKNEDHLRELVSFLIQSNNQTFPIDIGSGLEIKPGQHCGLTTVLKQKNNVTKKFTLRLNVVTSEMFEEAMRNAQIFSLELAYSNIFPSDCRMFICLPVYKDGYINRKDRKDRGQNI